VYWTTCRVTACEQNPVLAVYSMFGGQLRKRRDMRDMRKTLDRIKVVVEE
jgi:hypothetical protein